MKVKWEKLFSSKKSTPCWPLSSKLQHWGHNSIFAVPDKCFPNAYVFSDYYPVKWMTLTPKLKTVCILATKNLFTYPYNLHSKYKKKFWLSWTPNTSNAFFPHSYECIIHVKALSRTHLILFWSYCCTTDSNGTNELLLFQTTCFYWKTVVIGTIKMA